MSANFFARNLLSGSTGAKAAAPGSCEAFAKAYYAKYIATNSIAPLLHVMAIYCGGHFTISQFHKHSQHTHNTLSQQQQQQQHSIAQKHQGGDSHNGSSDRSAGDRESTNRERQMRQLRFSFHFFLPLVNRVVSPGFISHMNRIVCFFF